MKFKDIDTSSGGTDFMLLNQGDNKVRVVSEAEERYFHWDTENNRSIFVDSITDLKDGKKPKRRYAMYVIDRADETIKLLEVGVTVIKQIKELASSKDYAFIDVPGYDITIKKTGAKLDTEYTVLPDRENKKLTADEKKAVDELSPLAEVLKKIKAGVPAPPMETPDSSSKDDVPFD